MCFEEMQKYQEMFTDRQMPERPNMLRGDAKIPRNVYRQTDAGETERASRRCKNTKKCLQTDGCRRDRTCFEEMQKYQEMFTDRRTPEDRTCFEEMQKYQEMFTDRRMPERPNVLRGDAKIPRNVYRQTDAGETERASRRCKNTKKCLQTDGCRRDRTCFEEMQKYQEMFTDRRMPERRLRKLLLTTSGRANYQELYAKVSYILPHTATREELYAGVAICGHIGTHRAPCSSYMRRELYAALQCIVYVNQLLCLTGIKSSSFIALKVFFI